MRFVGQHDHVGAIGQRFGSLAGVFAIRHRDRNAIFQQTVDLAIRRFEAYGRTVARELVDAEGP